MRLRKIARSLTDEHSGYLNAHLLATLLSTLLILILVLNVPQGIGNDPSEQMRAMQQYLSGYSPSFNQQAIPLNNDLLRDKQSWIFSWPPGLQFLTYPLIVKGLSMGDALRVIAAICFILGSIGWVRWFSLFRLPLWIKIALAICMPWGHYANSPLFSFSAECFSYASAPWLLVATYVFTAALSKKQIKLPRMLILSAGLGLCLGSVYLLKYSTIFVSLGALLYTGWTVWRLFKEDDRKFARAAAAGFTLMLFCFAIPVAALNLVNYKFAANANLTSVGTALILHWQYFVFFLANPAMALADADAMWSYVLLHPQNGLAVKFPWFYGPQFHRYPMFRALFGLPGSLLLFWLILRLHRRLEGQAKLALFAFFVNIFVLLGIWFLTYNVDYQPRYIATGTIAILPFVIGQGISAWRHYRRRIMRFVLTAAAAVYLVVPFLYGGVSAVCKARRPPGNYAAGPSRLYNPMLSETSVRGVRAQLLRDFDVTRDIWYIPDISSGLDLPGRAIIRKANFIPIKDLQKEKFLASAPLGVFMLLPHFYEQSGKGKVIRGSFPQAGQWKNTPIKGSQYVLWTTTLTPSPLDIHRQY